MARKQTRYQYLQLMQMERDMIAVRIKLNYIIETLNPLVEYVNKKVKPFID